MEKTNLKTWLLSALMIFGTSTAGYAHGDKSHGQVSPAALDSLYNSYLTIQKSLSRDDVASARKESEAFLKKPIALPKELSHSVKALDLLQDYRALSAAEDIKSGREAFRSLSERMVVLMSEAYTGKDSVLVFFCPMTNGRKGARWVQDERKIANPYYGKSMLTCGSLKAQVSPSTAKKSEDKVKSHVGGEHKH
jgi:hypothetical protein